MLPIILGVVAASVFGIVSTMVLGSEGLMTHAWVDVVFWSLIGAGTAVSAINMTWECLPCRLSQVTHNERLIKRLCRNSPCAH